MIDIAKVEKYIENNRIEAKKAMGGLPKSIWETYSAFANTLGGVILLGVEEYRDKSFHVIDLPNPEALISEFKDKLSNKKIVSSNILSDQDISIEKFDGKRFIVINVPRAHRFDKPVFIDGNAYSGTYRRGGEGDYKCTREEVEGMQRDANAISGDMRLVESLDETVLDPETVSLYRQKLKSILTPDPFYSLDDLGFLQQIGALSKSKDQKYRPTIAGLLMFGKKQCILSQYKNFLLSYREKNSDGADVKLIYGENLYNFYNSVYNRILRNICLLGMNMKDEIFVGGAICEALVNALIHADYNGVGGIIVEMAPENLSIGNPGSLRFDIDKLKNGGISDKRNEALAKMFYLMGIGDGARGVRGIYEVWLKKGWRVPEVIESFSPDRVTLKLSIGYRDSTNGHKTNEFLIPSRRISVINYITEQITVTNADIAALLGTSRESAARLLKSLCDENIIVCEKRGKTNFYKLKS